MTKHKTGGRWTMEDAPAYFVASNTQTLSLVSDTYPFLLVAVNELESEKSVAALDKWLKEGRRVLLDSGVFWLATSNAKKRGLSMDEGLALPPEEVDGFDELFERYTGLVRTYGDSLWGYIEIDQGGRENKKRTRSRLHGMGFDPIPVYHPFNDGWDYFDELANNYNRICFGNVVQADRETRKRLVATAWERRRKHPDLWIHLLGYTPDEKLMAFPSDSADSSTWLAIMRWPKAATARSCGRTMGSFPRPLWWEKGSQAEDPTGMNKAVRLAAEGCYWDMMNWRRVLADYGKVLGADWRGTIK